LTIHNKSIQKPDPFTKSQVRSLISIKEKEGGNIFKTKSPYKKN